MTGPRNRLNFTGKIPTINLDEYIPERDDLTGLVDDSELLFNLGLKLANENIYPKWKEGSEFKAIREEQK